MTMPGDDGIGASDAFERFFEVVVAEPGLFDRLRVASDDATLARLAVELGRARGLEFLEADVTAALATARRTWRERRTL